MLHLFQKYRSTFLNMLFLQLHIPDTLGLHPFFLCFAGEILQQNHDVYEQGERRKVRATGHLISDIIKYVLDSLANNVKF